MRRTLLLVVTVLVAAACTTTSDPTTTSAASTTSATTAPSTTTAVVPAGLDAQIEWVTAVLNGQPTDEEEVEERFSQVLLEYVPAVGFLEIVEQLRSTISETWTPTERNEAPGGATVEYNTDTDEWVMAISTNESGEIETLLIQPMAPETIQPLESFEDLADRLSEFGRVSIEVNEVTSGTCQPIVSIDGQAVRPIGSTFKLYVLGAVADAVARGDLSWDDEIPIRDELKSLPSGTFQTRPEGSTATVLQYAEAMISVSDNTATDHLIDLVGREAVESAYADYGNAELERNRPLVMTREMFVLKLAAPQDVVDAWLAGTEAERRDLLDDPIAGLEVSIADAVAWVAPRLIDEIEWFADAPSQCRVLTGLMATATIPDAAEVRDVLSINPGAAFDADEWSYVGYKGGSEPGVINLAWYLESTDGTAYTYVVNVSNPDALLPEFEIATLANESFDLLSAG